MHTGLFWNTTLCNVKVVSCSVSAKPQITGSGATKILARYLSNGIRGQLRLGGVYESLRRPRLLGPCLSGLEGIPGMGFGAGRRTAFWSARSREPDSRTPTQQEEEAGKAAILDKVMKGRQPTDLMLRCTILDKDGNVTTISGQFKKAELSAEHQLNPRDLRKIDSRVPNLVPTILVRKHAFLVNILHIRALVKADTVVLFDTYGSADSRLHSVFLYHLEHNLKSKSTGLPYEFRALDSILLSVLSALEAELVFVRNLVGGLLAEMEDDIDHDRFKRLLHYSRRLAGFQSRAKLVGEALEEILRQDDDLDGMYLSDKKNGIEKNGEHEDLEVLLEGYEKQVEEIVNEVGNIETNVQSTQEIVELILDSNRNALLSLDLQMSIATFGVGTGALIAGLFGMNLQNHMESHPYAFYGISALAGFAAFIAIFSGFRKLMRIKRVGLSTSSASHTGFGSRSSKGKCKDAGEEKRRGWLRLPLPLRRRGSGWEGWGF
ncbi:hypothetical protein D9758_012591 [Tetrapyrgos nigripes]|uniref:Magnesium transporter n=1 Tax=Tetrapyrgos nigripes TaxID=182062 RepID=A0A8H5FLZ9_9AGAR|nr:hypothetical protein D9758_012591 [Tetrapyrgos nigripes]